MLFRKPCLALATAFVLAGVAATAAGQASAADAGGSTSVVSTQPMPTQSMQRLQEAADRLRQSIQALAQKPPGAERERAIADAHEALMRTQQAMLLLPPELRSTGTVSTGDYDRSVRKLMASADSLRHATQQMARQPAGERRNEAIREANRALLDAQSAMVAAYQPGDSSQSMGASGSGASAQGRDRN